MITVSDLQIQFGKRVLFQEVNLKFTPGNCYGIIGANGCGKSTLMKALIGSVSKSGESNLVLMNRDIVNKDNDLSFGFVPEEPILYDYLSVLKNFELSSVSKGIYDNLNEIQNLIKILRLEHLAKRKARSLSQGEKKRLSIGLALVGNPDVMILDEPHNGLDIDGMAILKSIIKIKSKDHIIILCSHYFGEIESLCTHILALNEGRVIVNDSIESVLEQHQSIENLFNNQIYTLAYEANFTF